MDAYPTNCPEPVRRPVMLQSWTNLTFVHWDYPPEVVQAILPSELRVDTFEGRAWVGLIPFAMEHIRPWGFPKGIPWIGTFPETNIRTYVVGPDGVPGVWFCSLDITRLGAVLVSWLTYDIPYKWSKMSITATDGAISYVGRRRWPGPRGAGSEVVVEIGEPIPTNAMSPLDRFLTSRWGLWAMTGSGPRYAPVDHGPWPLHEATPVHVAEDLASAAGLPAPDAPMHVRFTPGVDVRIGRPRRSQSAG